MSTIWSIPFPPQVVHYMYSVCIYIYKGRTKDNRAYTTAIEGPVILVRLSHRTGVVAVRLHSDHMRRPRHYRSIYLLLFKPIW